MRAKSFAAAATIFPLVALCLHLAQPRSACVQAWLPQKGEGRITLGYQGRALREMQMGVNVGRDLEGVIPGSNVHGRYSYAVVEGVEEFNLNRSNVEGEFGYLATRRLALRFLAALQRTHGGLEVGKDNGHPHYELIHDQATRANFVRLGGGGTFSVTRSLDLHAD